MNIYVHKDGTQYGPYILEQLQEYIQQGSFTLQDLACHDGQNWVPVAQVPGIAPAATSPAQPAAQPKTPAKASAAKKNERDHIKNHQQYARINLGEILGVWQEHGSNDLTYNCPCQI